MKVLNQVATDTVSAKEAEMQCLSLSNALFTTIKDDLDQYLAQDFQHYSEGDLTDLLADKEDTL